MVKMRQIFIHNLSKIMQPNDAPEASYICGMLGIDFNSVANIFMCRGREQSKAWLAEN